VGVTLPTSIALRISTLAATTGQLGTIASSQRFKHDIQTMIDESSNLFNLRPVTFAYNGDETETMQYGLIAEEVDEVFPLLVVKDEKGEPFSVQYDALPVLLLNEMKKQQTTINDLTNKVEVMNAALNSLQTQMNEFIERMKNTKN